MKWIVLTLLIVFLGKMAFAENAIEKKVSDHMSNTETKIEIERQQREVELMRENPKIRAQSKAKPASKKRYIERNTYHPDVSQKDPEVVQDHFEQQGESDVAYQAQRDVQAQQEAQKTNEINQKKFIEEFKRRAKEAGVDVDIDPKTLKATPR